jgi:hypothetical protein
MGRWGIGGGGTVERPDRLNTLMTMRTNNARPTTPPTAIPMIVDVDSLPDPKDEPCEPDVEEAFVVEAPDPVVVACTVAGSVTALYPFPAQYCA